MFYLLTKVTVVRNSMLLLCEKYWLPACVCARARACWRASWFFECVNIFRHEIIGGCVKQFN